LIEEYCDLKNKTVDEDQRVWLEVCRKLKDELKECDCNEPVSRFEEIIREMPNDSVYICDVGNNEFWFSRAFEKIGKCGTVLISKSFGTLGVGLGRAIGAYYGVRKSVTCVIGDQGFQYNLQELNYIRQWDLPIRIVLLNNLSSGMISDHERKVFGDRLIHVNADCGYSTPDFIRLVSDYGIRSSRRLRDFISCNGTPFFYEIDVDPDIVLTPELPRGNPCQDMVPLIEREKFDELNMM
jgi:acetolactate synthase-1/2/3 large subunit